MIPEQNTQEAKYERTIPTARQFKVWQFSIQLMNNCIDPTPNNIHKYLSQTNTDPSLDVSLITLKRWFRNQKFVDWFWQSTRELIKEDELSLRIKSEVLINNIWQSAMRGNINAAWLFCKIRGMTT